MLRRGRPSQSPFATKHSRLIVFLRSLAIILIRPSVTGPFSRSLPPPSPSWSLHLLLLLLRPAATTIIPLHYSPASQYLRHNGFPRLLLRLLGRVSPPPLAGLHVPPPGTGFWMLLLASSNGDIYSRPPQPKTTNMSNGGVVLRLFACITHRLRCSGGHPP